MKDRRVYSRLPVNLKGNIFMSGEEKSITISNISEKGIGFYVDDNCYEDLKYKPDDLINIQFVDEYAFESEHYTSIQTLVGRIVQVRRENERYYVGCFIDVKLCPHISDFDYPYYVEHRKSCNYVNVVKYTRFK